MNKERLERYSLAGPENQAAVSAGLTSGDWFRSAVPRKRMKELMRRSDHPAIRDTIIWLGLMALFAGLGIAFWGSWWAVPFFLAYGLLYGSTSDSRWHEAGHGTAFKTRWVDQGLYQLASFMIMRDPTTWRWSHTRHHTDTLILGRDPEIAVMRSGRPCWRMCAPTRSRSWTAPSSSTPTPTPASAEARSGRLFRSRPCR